MSEKKIQTFDKIKLRLLQFAKNQSLVMGDFYKKIDLAPSNFSGDAMFSALKSDNIVKVLTVYPELSADWLLLEKGEMLRKNNSKNINITSGPQSIAGDGTLNVAAPAQLLDIISSQQETINRQASIIDRLSK